jgi:A/G-specific adenine glycosylase
VAAVLAWYAVNRRDLPWRRPETTPWGVMVSEFMLQQTPVSGVREPWLAWMIRWPTPAALAAEAPGEAVRAWGRLGYPRRALRLHRAAVVIAERHGGVVPPDHAALLALPGVGSYTAAAIASFAFGQRHVVLDTNVRRVLARVAIGTEFPARSTTPAETALAEQFLPTRRERAASWAVASMELGAVICTARTPRCDRCPIRRRCAWHAAGQPRYDGPPRQVQTYEGTDRQCRGALLAVLRTNKAVAEADLLPSWPDPPQRVRALASLEADGLLVRNASGQVTLP